ncbi:hypothetical protein FHS16_003459 [Paenibacillus endophyticus]|uniref:Fibronectin type-III domain-containing protein n=1 Tax=Paenibacillus endophyticus TaxID=1294268 RepID=A0A7W5C9C9_9BACL|nr:fibronectin type III domain-containing protein [Paenibacillus endophyticus]MBB3153397.1 hypothetical protein [Paenibacillus endophyticus]
MEPQSEQLTARKSYAASGLTNGTLYYFVVKTVNAAGDSELSNEVTSIPLSVPQAPQNGYNESNHDGARL